MTSNNHEFDDAFKRMKSAVRLCMGLAESADPETDKKDVWAGVDAIVESASRDVKDIWKKKYATPTNGRALQAVS